MNVPDVNIITSINPINEEIDIAPHEILQVVFIGYQNINWRTLQQLSFIHLKCLRHETYYADNLGRHLGSNFEVIAHKEYGKLQQHFWFRVNPGDSKRIQELEETNHPLMVIAFTDGDEIIGKLKVNLSAQRRDKNAFIELMEKTLWAGIDPIANDAYYRGLSNRIVKESIGYILNPGLEEEVTFEAGQRNMLVEIGEHTYERWRPQLINNMWSGEKNLDVKELSCRYINGICIQRFLIQNYLYDLPNGVDRMRLGDIKLILPENPAWNKKLNCFIVENREESLTDSNIDGYDDETYCVIQRFATTYLPSLKPKISEVVIEEIDGNLTTGAKLIKLFMPTIRNLNKYLVVADPANNSLITVSEGEELVIMLYLDKFKLSNAWKLESHGNCLKVRFVDQDLQRQQFYFKVNEKPNSYKDTLVFRNGDKVRKINIIQEKNVYEQICDAIIKEKNTEKVLSELLDHPTIDWRTSKSLSFETQVPIDHLIKILDEQEKCGIIIRHPDNEFDLWGHSQRVAKR